MCLQSKWSMGLRVRANAEHTEVLAVDLCVSGEPHWHCWAWEHTRGEHSADLLRACSAIECLIEFLLLLLIQIPSRAILGSHAVGTCSRIPTIHVRTILNPKFRAFLPSTDSFPRLPRARCFALISHMRTGHKELETSPTTFPRALTSCWI